MATKKRTRDDDEFWEVDEALQQLQGTLERDSQHKIRALDKIIALIDSSDEGHNVQKALVAGDAAFYITELLADATAGVKAAEAVAAICRHSAPSMARLAAGPLLGLDSSLERVSLNPCQADFADSGAVAALVPMALQKSEAAREAASEALSALCSFHQDGKLAYLESLVQALQQRQQPEVLELLDALIDGMECGSDAAAQQLELLQQPLLAALQASRGQPTSQSQAAISLLGTLCERRPEAAAAIRELGAVASLAQHLLNGGLEVQDVASRALWLLVKEDRRCLAAEKGLLGCDAVPLARMLIHLIELVEAEEARARQDFGDTDGGEEDQAGAGAVNTAAGATTDICHGEEASALLKALAAAYPEVQKLMDEREVPLMRPASQKCCIQ